jgi:hypothetical protein
MYASTARAPISPVRPSKPETAVLEHRTSETLKPATADRRIGVTVVPPLAAWVLATGAVLGACVWAGKSPWQARPWSYGDANLYLDIARHGYTLFRCGADWCGNAGWFPLFAWLTAGLHAVTGVPALPAAIGLAWFFHAATLVLLWTTFLGRRFTFGALGALVFAAFAPGLVFHESLFPMSLLAFFTLLHLWLLHRGRWVGAGLAGAAAVLSYPVGIVLVLTSAVWLLAEGGSLSRRVRAVASASGLTAAGLAIFLIDQRIETGSWKAYLLVQRKYDHRFEQPFAQLENALHILHRHSPFALATVAADQTVLVAAVLVCGLTSLVLGRRFDRLSLLLMIWAIASYVLPQTESEVQSYRLEATLLPFALFLPRLPRPLVALFVITAVCLSVPLARLSFEGRLF